MSVAIHRSPGGNPQAAGRFLGREAAALSEIHHRCPVLDPVLGGDKFLRYGRVMSAQHLVVECNDPAVMGGFWAEALRLAHKGDGVLFASLAGSQREISISFVAATDEIHRQGFHFRLSPDSGSLEAEVYRIQELGATLVSKKYKGGGVGEVTMKDPEGNIFFVESGSQDLDRYETMEKWESDDPFWADATPDRPKRNIGVATASDSHA